MRITIALFALAALAACAQKTELEPQANQPLPPPQYGATTESTADELLEPPPQAVPERDIELRRRSEEREDDPFDLPPE